MNSVLKTLSIITITYNNPADLVSTYNSLKLFRKAGGTHIIVNGGKTVQELLIDDCILLEEPDKGIYDALNKGISLVQTVYLMLIHSGDFLVAPCSVLERQLQAMNERNLDILLNNCTIDFGRQKRLMSSKIWRPWMFKLGAQPPHTPIIYRTAFVNNFKYDLRHPIIADFDYLERIFKEFPKYDKGGQILINMSAGGKTSSGLYSFLVVNREFRKLKGNFLSSCFIFTRPIVKIIQMI